MADVASILHALSQPAAYPYEVDAVAVHQTHISMVFLAGSFVYKIKKSVQLGFLDFSTLERRRHFCEEEVRLNRRLAPSVYLGVVPVTQGDGGLCFEGEGPALEWAVKMRRLPDEATLESRLERNEVAPQHLKALAERLARFHAGAECNEHTASFGRFDVVARNCRENFEQTLGHVGKTVHPAVFERVRDGMETMLARLRPQIEARAQRLVPRDTHGDLHLDHVYHFPDQPPPEDWVIIDCIEFNERFRYADPMADVAFLTMDLIFHGRRVLAQTLAEAYRRASGDDEGQGLLPLYTAYRALIRAKVEGIVLTEAEIDEAERAAAQERARAHWLLALDELETTGKRPGLVLVGGLPGTGKSTLARALGERHGFTVVRSDVVRKELAAGEDTDIYTRAWTERTYEELERRAAEFLWQGGRIIVDANCRKEEQRRRLLDLGQRLGVRTVLLWCEANPDVIRARLRSRHDDASDADWQVYQQLAPELEPPEPDSCVGMRVLDANGSPEHLLVVAEAALHDCGLIA